MITPVLSRKDLIVCMILGPSALFSCCCCCAVPPIFFPGFMIASNLYRTSTIPVFVHDSRTKQPIPFFTVKVLSRERYSNFKGHFATGVQGPATVFLEYETAMYQRARRPARYYFFNEFALELKAPGYQTKVVLFPRYVTQGGELPPAVLPSATFELEREDQSSTPAAPDEQQPADSPRTERIER